MARHIPADPIGFRLAHELTGLLAGIESDGVIVRVEVERVARWLEAAAPYRQVRPFAEIAARLRSALADGILTREECEDLRFVASTLTKLNPYVEAVRAGVQELMGLVAGIAADRVVPTVELHALQDWLDEWSELKGTWPYDECEAIAVDVLAGSRHPAGREYLIQLASEFPIGGADEDRARPLTLAGICTVAPAIEFPGRLFVFTGDSMKAPRETMESHVRRRQGFTERGVTRATDYLVVSEGGNPHWTLACYGRKVEEAYELRSQGFPLAIVAECDFWDALAKDV
jgi:hypothetical protein